MLRLRPPQQSIDDVVEWISPTDPAWDYERVKSEQTILEDAAIAAIAASEPAATPSLEQELRKTAALTHPMSVWFEGGSRWSHEALLTVPALLRTEERPEAAVKIAAYLTGPPTVFELRKLDAREYRKAMAESADEQRWHLAMVRRGLVKITGVGEDGLEVKPELNTAGLIAWSTMDWLDKHDRLLIVRLASAIHLACQGQSELGKP